MSLHCSFAFSREQIRNEPPILRWSEYVSSGGGVSRCLSITGMRLWILSVVDWEPNSKVSVEAKASPRIITASTWAFIIGWTQKGEKNTAHLVSAYDHLVQYNGSLLQTKKEYLQQKHICTSYFCSKTKTQSETAEPFKLHLNNWSNNFQIHISQSFSHHYVPFLLVMAIQVANCTAMVCDVEQTDSKIKRYLPWTHNQSGTSSR